MAGFNADAGWRNLLESQRWGHEKRQEGLQGLLETVSQGIVKNQEKEQEAIKLEKMKLAGQALQNGNEKQFIAQNPDMAPYVKKLEEAMLFGDLTPYQQEQIAHDRAVLQSQERRHGMSLASSNQRHAQSMALQQARIQQARARASASGGSQALPSNVRSALWLADPSRTPEEINAFHQANKLYSEKTRAYEDQKNIDQRLNPGIAQSTEQAKVIGKATGEATRDYKIMNAGLENLNNVVKELDKVGKIADYNVPQKIAAEIRTQTGQPPSKGQIARTTFESMVDNVILPQLRLTFGAQFTQREGETLRKTLGAPDKAPAEKTATLKAFIRQKKRNMQDQFKTAKNLSKSGTSIALTNQDKKAYGYMKQNLNSNDPTKKQNAIKIQNKLRAEGKL